MKIKINKSQWQKIGREAGWIKTSQSAFTGYQDKYPELRQTVDRMLKYLKLEVDNRLERIKRMQADLDDNNIEALKEHVRKWSGEHSSEYQRIKFEGISKEKASWYKSWYNDNTAETTKDPEILKKILEKGKDDEVSRYAARNPHCPPEALSEVLKREKNDDVSWIFYSYFSNCS